MSKKYFSFLLLFCLSGVCCVCTKKNNANVNPSPPPPIPSQTGPNVDVWLTKSDHSALLQKQPTLSFWKPGQ